MARCERLPKASTFPQGGSVHRTAYLNDAREVLTPAVPQIRIRNAHKREVNETRIMRKKQVVTCQGGLWVGSVNTS